MREIFANLFKPASSIGTRQRAFRHFLMGGVTTAIYFLLVMYLVEYWHLAPVTSVTLSFLVLITLTYIGNRLWVYTSQRSHTQAISRFLVVIAISFALNTGIMYIANSVLGLWYIWGLFIAAAVVPTTNFLLNNYWAFR